MISPTHTQCLSTSSQLRQLHLRNRLGALLVGAILSAPLLCAAAETDIARAPLTGGASGQVKPNIMLLMDTSQSLAYTHMPDAVEGTGDVGVLSIGYKNFQCNAIYFNPNGNYPLPKGADGLDLPMPSYASAPYNGYSLGLGNVDLTSGFQAYFYVPGIPTKRTIEYNGALSRSDTPQGGYYYVYTGPQLSAAGKLDFTTTPCRDPITTATAHLGTQTASGVGGGEWKRYELNSATADMKLKFAIWYTYYRIRINLTKSSVSLAFTPLTDAYRVGLITTLPAAGVNSPVLASKYLPIADFGAAQRTDWFNKLFAQAPEFSSPTREALARVGRHYAGKQDLINDGMTGDPVQYSCQQNFVILTTDGVWNGGTPPVPPESTPGGPVGLDGTTLVGQQDGLLALPGVLPGTFLPCKLGGLDCAPRPMWDGGGDVTQTITDKLNKYREINCNSPYWLWTMSQVTRETLQQRQRTLQYTTFTQQTTQTDITQQQSTQQDRASTQQDQRLRVQFSTETLQNLARFRRQTETLDAVIRATDLSFTRNTIQRRQTITQRLADTRQNFADQREVRSTLFQQSSTVTRVERTRYQNRQTVNQLRRTSLQNAETVFTALASTSQTTRTRTQVRRSTFQIEARNTVTELRTPVLVCPATGHECTTLTTGPTFVATCTNSAAAIGNDFVATTCTPLTPVVDFVQAGTCIAGTALTADFTTTACSVNAPGPTPVAACVNETATVGNNWFARVCSTSPAVPVAVPVATCMNQLPIAGNAFVRRDCTTPINEVDKAIPFATACADQTALVGNGWTTITCTPLPARSVTTFIDPVCAPVSESVPNWISTTCPGQVVTHADLPVTSCTQVLPGVGPDWIKTTCNPITVTAAQFVASCTAGTTQAVPSPFESTTCANTINSVVTPLASGACSIGTTGAPNHIRTTACPADLVSLNVPVASCTAGAIAATTPFRRTDACPAPNILLNKPVSAVCAVNANLGSFEIITNCPAELVTTTFIPAACTNGLPAPASPGWLRKTCPAAITTGPFPLQATCTNIPPDAGNSFVETICTSVSASSTQVLPGDCTVSVVPPLVSCTPTILGDYGVNSSCTAGVVRNVTVNESALLARPNAPYRATCNAQVQNTGVPIAATCTDDNTRTIANDFTRRSCPGPTTATTPATFLASCTVGTTSTGTTGPASAHHTQTICKQTMNVPDAVSPGTCVGSGVPVIGPFITTTCPAAIVTTDVPVPPGTCVLNAVSASPNFVKTTACNPLTSGPTAVAFGTCAVNAVSASPDFVKTTACPQITPAPYFSSSCAVLPGTVGPFVKTACSTSTAPTTGIASCTPGTTNAGAPDHIRTTCTYTDSGALPVQDGTCAATPPDIGNGFTTTSCTRTDVAAAFVNPATCAASSPGIPGNLWVQTICTPVTSSSGAIPVATCPGAGSVSEAPNAGNAWKTTTCTQAPGKKQQYQTFTDTLVKEFSNGTHINITASVASGPTAWTDTNGFCYADNAAFPAPILPLLPTDGRPGNLGRPLVPAPDPATCGTDLAAWPCTVTSTGGTTLAGGANTLADVAQYYYVNDLRPALENNVPGTGSGAESDSANWQHMTTFVIGLGVTGARVFDPNYKSTGAGDFADIRAGTKFWPVPPLSGATPVNLQPNTIDDFWHAAVNGRGQYFSADNPQSVISGLSAALVAIGERLGSGAAAGASASRLVEGADNFAYFSNYTTQRWTGELEARVLDIYTATPSAVVTWSARDLLDAKTKVACDDRTIYLMRQGGANGRTNFTWNTRGCDAGGNPVGAADNGLNASEKAFFNSTTILGLSQYVSMTDGTAATANQRGAADNANLVNFIRGQRGKEGFEPNQINKLYRRRENVLGASINAQPVYLKVLGAEYEDPGYAAYKTSVAARIPMVYVPANDGMLHAFYAGENIADPLAGQEAWGMIPSTVLPNLYKLADTNFGSNFQYTVDGSPTVGDYYDTGAAAWKSMLVAGLNAGGRGYYAVDVTDPVNPKGMWEFKWSDTCYDGTVATAGADCHIGLTFGVPVLTKLADGTWVVMVTSGYNNVNAPAKIGDGKGYLYILNAGTGKIIRKISTNVGDAITPSGLSRISNYVDNTRINNTTLRVYGGDLLGNLWRFDTNDTISPAGYEATLVTTLKDTGGNPQPITTRPELGETEGKTMVLVGTGRLLGTTDLTNTSVQSLYGIIDIIPNDGSTLYPDVRASLRPNTMATVGAGNTRYRTVACTVLPDCAGANGWVVDFPDVGERVNIDIKLQLGTIVAATNVPQGTACNIGGYSWFNSFNFATGLAVAGSANGSVSQLIVPAIGSPGLTTGFNFFQVPDGSVRGFVTDALGNRISVQPPVSVAPPVGKRISWQELTP